MATKFTNQAAINFNGVRTLSNVAVGVLEGNLSATKTAVQQEYTNGSEITYVVNIINNSDAAATGLTVADDLGAYAFGTGTVQPLTYADGSVQYYVNGVLQPAPVVSTADGLTLSGISVPANGNVTIIYAAEVNSYAPLEAGSTVDNTVTVSGTGVSSITAEESITAQSGVLLSIIKSVTPVPVYENGTLTYTFQLFNEGNTAVTADDNATVSDTFDPALTDISVSLNGTPLAPTDYTYDEATGVFSTADGVIAIPAATYTQDAVTGEWTTVAGSATLTITGTITPA